MNIEFIVDKSGPVVWVLLAYSVIALAIILECYYRFFSMGKSPEEGENTLKENLRKKIFNPIAELKGPEAVVVTSMLEEFKNGVADLGRVASRVGSEELQKMEKGFRTLAFLGNTAPLLGLFGTITGMIKAFMVIEAAGGKVDASALAGGIWEAMLTTGVGLAISVPVLFMLHTLEGMADKRTSVMKKLASIILERLPHLDNDFDRDRVTHRKGAEDGI